MPEEVPVEIEVKKFGILLVRSAGVTPNAQLATGWEHSQMRFSWLRHTDRIPLRKGVHFGFTVVPKGGNTGGSSVTVRRVLRFPGRGIRDPQSGKRHACEEITLDLKPGEERLLSYGLDDDGEMVPGEWTYEFWLGNRKLAQRSFKVTRFNNLLYVFLRRKELRRIEQAYKDNLIRAALASSIRDLKDGESYDIFLLQDRGIIRARATGESITEVQASIENLSGRNLTAVIPPGTYFVASGAHQNMATTAEHRIDLEALSIRRISLGAACINANLPVPNKHNSFNGIARTSRDVARFLEASQKESSMTIQAGVWAVTDGYTREQAKQHLVARTLSGLTTHPITDWNCDRAKAILDKLGIRNRL